MSDASPLSATAVRPRRNLRWVALGVLAICLGGLGSAFLYLQLADAHAVVRVTRTIYRGEVVQASDLDAITLGAAVGLRTVPATEAASLIGQTALTDLPSGSLLVPGSLGPPEVESGVTRIGLKLAPGRLPISPLPAGTPILLVAVAKDTQSEPDGASVIAEVATAPSSQTDGSLVLDVSVPAAQAERIARLAALDLIVVVRRAVT